jgi:hypothetical protein
LAPRVLVACLVILAGCGGDTPPEIVESSERLTKIQQLEDKVRAQGEVITMKDAELQRQADELRRSRSTPGDIPVEQLVHAEKIQIDRLSGGYDENRDGQPDGIRVYFRPIDQFGGGLRATGRAHVKLLDLTAPQAKQIVGEAQYDAKQLEETWFGALLSAPHYTLTVPWKNPPTPPTGKTITVLVTFNDLLTGRSFDAQRAVEVIPLR